MMLSRVCLEINSIQFVRFIRTSPIKLDTKKDLTPEVKKKKNLQRKVQLEKLGAKFCIDTGNSRLDCVEKVGLVEKREQFDGKTIYTVLPTGNFHRAHPTVKNAKFDDDLRRRFNRVYTWIGDKHWFMRGLPGITQECIHSSSYYFEDGFRKVRPYYKLLESIVPLLSRPCTLQTYVRSMLFKTTEDWVAHKIERGYIQVNFQRCSPDVQLKEGDFLTSLNHYHEIPVLDEPIDILFDNDDILVVNKPSSMLVYPASSYRLNTLIYILAKEKGYMNLRPVHRLDKNTSGVCILSKAPHVTRRLQTQLKSPSGHYKEYLAMVEGSFPEHEVTMETPLVYSNIKAEFFQKVLEPKACVTSFKRIGYDGRTSLVHCIPKTGRTHQIRQHLQMLGYPILNDYLYNPVDKECRLKIDFEGIAAALEEAKSTRNAARRMLPSAERWQESLTARFGEKAEDCLACHLGDDYLRKKYLNQEMFMGLHAWKYSIDGKLFEAPLPKWATDSSYIDKVFEKRRKFHESRNCDSAKSNKICNT